MDADAPDVLQRIEPRPIEDEMKDSYIDYAMSVIISRALPDVRDGLKPVHRRILYAMSKLGLHSNKPFKKSASVVGEVLAKYHPHGDSAVYDALVRMAQDFSLRYPLVEGQGNFGSIDGDPPAAYRYTEAKLQKIAEELLVDIDEETVDFVANFDDSEEEPVVLPAKLPNLLIGGTDGIAVGLATKIPPHNLREVVDGLIHLLEHPEATIEDLMKIIPGPDFPTGGLIMSSSALKDAYTTGRGRIVMRAKTEVEEFQNGRQRIIVTEIPYQVNKSKLLEDAANLVRQKKIDGITDIRDESDRRGMRIVFELRRGEIPEVITNHLLKMTQLQTTFGANIVGLIDRRPRQLNLKDLCSEFLQHRREVVTRRSRYRLKKARERLHILEGLKIALDNIDEVIQLIRGSSDQAEARPKLMSRFALSEVQAQTILDMRLARLTSLETQKILDEIAELMERITYLESVLGDIRKVEEIIRTELLEIREKYGDERRSQFAIDSGDFDPRDLYIDEKKVVTVTRGGYIKSLPADTYRQQHRGGKGKTGHTLKEEDVVDVAFVANTFDYVMFFTNKAQCRATEVYKLPEAGRTAKGKSLANLFNLKPSESIAAVIPVSEFKEDVFLVFSTKKGLVKRARLSDYKSCMKKGGIIGLKFASEDDELVRVAWTRGGNDIILGTRHGQSIRFSEDDVAPRGRVSQGVKGITLRPGDEVVWMDVLDPAEQKERSLLVVTEKGFGKRTRVSQYPRRHRGGKGVINIKVNPRNGPVAVFREVEDDDEVLIATEGGIIMRIPASSISKIGRNTQGVKVIDLAENDSVIGVTVLKAEPEGLGDDDDDSEGGGEPSAGKGSGSGNGASDPDWDMEQEG